VLKEDEANALVEALEKAGMEAYWKTQCRGITDHCEEVAGAHRRAGFHRESVAEAHTLIIWIQAGHAPDGLLG
jgi:hypothetical protein